MNNAFYTGVSGMVSYQKGLDTIAHNMANVNTSGYKTQRSSFKDTLLTKMDVKSNKEELTGHGVRHVKNEYIYSQGALNMTERPLDFAINGDGFFKLQRINEDGEELTSYTRAGNFNLSLEGEDAYLVTPTGYYVLDSNGDRIIVDKSKAEDGSNVLDYSSLRDKLGVYTFDNPYELEPVGDTMVRATERSGEDRLSADGQYDVVAGALENSQTNIVDQMTQLIETQRAYQFSTRIVQTADQIEEMVNNLR